MYTYKPQLNGFKGWWRRYRASIIALIIIFIVLSTIGLIKFYPTKRFCDRYFAEVPTWECMISDRYKYDGQ